MLKSKTKLDKK